MIQEPTWRLAVLPWTQLPMRQGGGTKTPNSITGTRCRLSLETRSWSNWCSETRQEPRWPENTKSQTLSPSPVQTKPAGSPTSGLSCWQAPWGTYKPVSPPWVPGLAQGHPVLTLLQVGEEACSSRQLHGESGAGAGTKRLPPRGPWGVLRAGAHTSLESELGVVLNICRWLIHITLPWTQLPASPQGGGSSRAEPHATGSSLPH